MNSTSKGVGNSVNTAKIKMATIVIEGNIERSQSYYHFLSPYDYVTIKNEMVSPYYYIVEFTTPEEAKRAYDDLLDFVNSCDTSGDVLLIENEGFDIGECSVKLNL